MQIVAALFVEEFEMRQAPGPSTRIDLTGVMFSMAAPEPAPLTITPPHAMRAFKNLGLTGQVLAQAHLHLGQVVLVHQLLPVGRTPLHLLVAVAHDGFPARREMHDVI